MKALHLIRKHTIVSCTYAIVYKGDFMKYLEGKIIETVKLTQEIEGITVSDNTEIMLRALVRGVKSNEQLLKEIKQARRLKKADKSERVSIGTSGVYTYPGTDILINTFDERNQENLDAIEEEITSVILGSLMIQSLKGDFSFKHLKGVHKRIFEEIYPFAGEIRKVNISKGGPGFCQVIFIEPIADETFRKLRKDDFLKGLDEDTFKEKLLYYMGELNALHPFREGNGRALREFLRDLCLNAGWLLDYTSFSKEQILEADICLFNGIEAKMKYLLDQGLVTAVEKEF